MELPGQAALALCPKCLLQAGLATQPGTGPGETVVMAQSARPSKGLPQPGEQFGHYQMVRLLGQGGMGVVYEAEDLENGRRVALKILGHALDSPEARRRFLREGQLAASINHPNSVYVFGTEEIAGTPVIAMELMTGGTLRDRVLATGPLPVSEAVESVLQIMAGLEAAQQIGILHRDVKPSNCFVDGDGTVKIGDFGLSITTAVRTESNLTATGTLFGTPAFSSPEQLRGDSLTVRSDIYAVGVTLYHLLTGRMPFEAESLVQLLATVLERRAESPAKWRAGIPKGLCRVVLRCLEKDAGERFGSYAKLREALLPYVALAAPPATLGLRFLAGCVDASLLVPLCFRISEFLEVRGWTWGSLFAFWGIILLYYGLLEGIGGASIGKALFGLRTVNFTGNPPGVTRALLRALIFVGGSMCPIDLMGVLLDGPVSSPTVMGLLIIPIWFAVLALTFVTARRRNGFAGVHDMASRTRVISKSNYAARPGLPAKSVAAPNPAATPQIGPYHVLDQAGEDLGSEILPGYDTRLLRKVWIRQLPPGAPEVGADLRNLARPGRLRWLNGKRSATESWDAYEATPGQPLLSLISERQSWSRVRFWLLDLAEELQTAQGSGPAAAVLRLDHIWITADGRAKLLDFPAPGTGSMPWVASASPATLPPTAPEFLRQVAMSALEGRPLAIQEARDATLARPLALHARTLIDALKPGVSLSEVVSQLRPLLGKLVIVSRMRRFALLAAAVWFPVLLTVSVILPQSRAELKTDKAQSHGGWRKAERQDRTASEPWEKTKEYALGLAWLYTITVVILPCLLAALLFRGGVLLRGLGIAVVTADGSNASRGRVFWRNFIAWAPVLAAPVPAALVRVLRAGVGEELPWTTFMWVTLAALAVPTVISLLLPERSLQDRLAGTYLVPR
jgi:uncharacterized RDD family membrane protein YckC